MSAENASTAKPDLDLSQSQQAAIEKLAKDENVILPPIWMAREAAIRNDAIERAHAFNDPDDFWAEKAKGIDWIEPWKEVCRFNPPTHERFIGGKLNATVNCIDRHVYGD